MLDFEREELVDSYKDGYKMAGFDYGKINKKQASDYLEKIDFLIKTEIKYNPTLAGKNIGIMMAELRNFFLPPISKGSTSKDDVVWCNSVIDGKNKISYANFIRYIEGWGLIGTNSRSLYIAKNFTPPDPNKPFFSNKTGWITKEHYMEFGSEPNFSNIIKDGTKMYEPKFLPVENHEKTEVYFELEGERVCFNAQYILNAKAGFKGQEVEYSYIKEDILFMFIIESKNRKAFVCKLKK